MPTYEQRELAGVSSVSKPVLPKESKHDSDEAYKKDHEIAIYQRDLRRLDNPMVEYNYHKELTNTLGNPRDMVLEQIKNGQFKNISPEEAIHAPYAHYKYAA